MANEVTNIVKTENGEVEQKVTMTTGNTLINVKSEENSIASLQVDENGAYALSLGADLKDAMGHSLLVGSGITFEIVEDKDNPPITLKTGLQDELLVDITLNGGKKGRAKINPTSVMVTLDDGNTYYATAEQGKGFDMDVSTKVVERMYSKSNAFFTTPIIRGVGKKAPNYLLGMYAEQAKDGTLSVSDDIGIIKTNGMVFFTQKVKDGTSLYIYDDGVPKKIEGYFQNGDTLVFKTSAGNQYFEFKLSSTEGNPFEELSIKKFPPDLSFNAGYELSKYNFSLRPSNEKVKNRIPFKVLRYHNTGEIVYVNTNEQRVFYIKDGKIEWENNNISHFMHYKFAMEHEVIGEAFVEKTKNGYFLIAEDKIDKIETEKDGSQAVTPASEEEYVEATNPTEQVKTDKKTPTNDIDPDEILTSKPAENAEGIVSHETSIPTEEISASPAGGETDEVIAPTAETSTEEAEAPATISPEASETDKAEDEKSAPTEGAEKDTAENAQGVVADDKPQKPAKPKDLKKQVEAISSIAMTIGLFMILVGSLFAPWLALVGIVATIVSGVTNTFAGSFKYTPFDSVKQKVKTAEQAEREGRGRERDSNELVASNENVASKEIAKEFENNESQLDEMFESAKAEQTELQELSEQEGSTANMFADLCNNHGIDCPTFDAPERTMTFENLTDPNNLDGLAYRTELVSQIDDIARTTDPDQKAQLIDNFFSTNFKDVSDKEREKYTQIFNDNRGLRQIRNHLASFNEHQQNAQDLLKQQREFYTDKKHGTARILQTVSSLPKDEQVKFFERYGDAVAYTLSQNKNVTTTLNTLLSSVDKDKQDKVRELLTNAEKDLKYTINENVSAVAQRYHQNVETIGDYVELTTLAEEAKKEEETKDIREAEKKQKEATKTEKENAAKQATEELEKAKKTTQDAKEALEKAQEAEKTADKEAKEVAKNLEKISAVATKAAEAANNPKAKPEDLKEIIKEVEEATGVHIEEDELSASEKFKRYTASMDHQIRSYADSNLFFNPIDEENLSESGQKLLEQFNKTLKSDDVFKARKAFDEACAKAGIDEIIDGAADFDAEILPQETDENFEGARSYYNTAYKVATYMVAQEGQSEDVKNDCNAVIKAYQTLKTAHNQENLNQFVELSKLAKNVIESIDISISEDDIATEIEKDTYDLFKKQITRIGKIAEDEKIAGLENFSTENLVNNELGRVAQAKLAIQAVILYQGNNEQELTTADELLLSNINQVINFSLEGGNLAALRYSNSIAEATGDDLSKIAKTPAEALRVSPAEKIAKIAKMAQEAKETADKEATEVETKLEKAKKTTQDAKEALKQAQEAEKTARKTEDKAKKEAEEAKKAVEEIEPSKIEQFNTKLRSSSFISSLPEEVQKQINDEADIQKKLEIINKQTSIDGKTFAQIIEDNKKENKQLDIQKLQNELTRTESVRVATEMLLAESHSTGIGNINDSNLRKALLEKNAILEGNTYEDVFDWIASKKGIERNEALKNYANLKKTYGNLSNSGMTQELFASLGLTDKDLETFKSEQKNIKNLKLTESVTTFELADKERESIKDEVKNETKFINKFKKLFGKVNKNGEITGGEIKEGTIKDGDFEEIKTFIFDPKMKNEEILSKLGISTAFNDLSKKQELKDELFKLIRSEEYADFLNEHRDKYNAVKEEKDKPYTIEMTLLNIKKKKYQKRAEKFKELYNNFIKNPNKEKNVNSLSEFLENVVNSDFINISGISVKAIQRLIENPTLAKSFDENEQIIEQIDNAQKRFDSRYEFLDKLANASSQEEIDAINEERRATLAQESAKSFEEKTEAINNLKYNKENAMNAVLKYYSLISALNEIDNTQEVAPRKPEFGKIYSLPKEKDLISDEEALDKDTHVPTGIKSRHDQKEKIEEWIKEVKDELRFYNFPMGSFDIETDRIFAGEFELSSEHLAKLVQMNAETTSTIGLTNKKAKKAKAKNKKIEAKRNKKIEKGFNELTSYIAKRQKSKEKDLEKTQEKLELSAKFKPSMRKTKIGLSVLDYALDGIEKQKQREQDKANKKKEAEEKAKETEKAKTEETKAKETETKAETKAPTDVSKKKAKTSTPTTRDADGGRE